MNNKTIENPHQQSKSGQISVLLALYKKDNIFLKRPNPRDEAILIGEGGK